MKLESLPKFYAPKTANLSATAPATGGERMTITDVMAAQGFVQSKTPLGFALFLAKAGIQSPDAAIELLALVAAGAVERCSVIAFLPEQQIGAVVRVLATMAYQDYSRSAASVRPCECCGGEGFIDAEVFTMRAVLVAGTEIERGEAREAVRILCRECKGKKTISNACQCSGRGVVKVFDSNGLQIEKTCGKCGGRGYSRLKFSAVLAGLREVWPELKKTTAYNEIGPFFEMLVTRCHAEEAAAGEALQEVTR
ncbi:antitermination protein [Salmonella enterica subsp. enterica]|nr:antitermination protein [Salmonella enterica subsp. enterica]